MTKPKAAPTFAPDELAALAELRSALEDPTTLAVALRSLAGVVRARRKLPQGAR